MPSSCATLRASPGERGTPPADAARAAAGDRPPAHGRADGVRIAAAGGTVEVWLDSAGTGTRIAECRITSTGGWNQFARFTAPVAPVRGNHDVYLRFSGSGSASLFQLKWFTFAGLVFGLVFIVLSALSSWPVFDPAITRSASYQSGLAVTKIIFPISVALIPAAACAGTWSCPHLGCGRGPVQAACSGHSRSSIRRHVEACG